MKAADLKRFLEGNLSALSLQTLIGKEVESWTVQFNERGRSAPIYLEEDQSLEVTRERALRLLDSLLNAELQPSSFAYILDALLLSESVHWAIPEVRDGLEQLVIPDTGAIEMSDAQETRDRLAKV